MFGREAFETDGDGQTELMKRAAAGDLEAVERIIFALPGTGISCQRLALIERKDARGRTAVDIAEAVGHSEIANLLGKELRRMEWYE